MCYATNCKNSRAVKAKLQKAAAATTTSSSTTSSTETVCIKHTQCPNSLIPNIKTLKHLSQPSLLYMSSSVISAEMFMSSSVPVMRLYILRTSSAQVSKWEAASYDLLMKQLSARPSVTGSRRSVTASKLLEITIHTPT